jgi:translation initiation factor 1 (eIF-1/SUI1)
VSASGRQQRVAIAFHGSASPLHKPSAQPQPYAQQWQQTAAAVRAAAAQAAAKASAAAAAAAAAAAEAAAAAPPTESERETPARRGVRGRGDDDGSAAAAATAQKAASIAVSAVAELSEYKRTHGAKLRALLRANEELKQELVRVAVEQRDNVRVKIIQGLRVQLAEQKTLLAALKEKLGDYGMSKAELGRFTERVLAFPLMPMPNVEKLEGEIEQLLQQNRRLKQELRVAKNAPATAIAAGIAAAASADPHGNSVRKHLHTFTRFPCSPWMRSLLSPTFFFFL